MKRSWKIATYVALAVSTFLFFFYLSFPYEVFKESLILKGSEVTGLNIQIGSLSPGFPLGLEGEQLSISSPKQTIKLQSASANIGFFSLLIGNLKLKLELQDTQQGSCDITMTFSLFDVLTEQDSLVPTSLSVAAHEFMFGQIVAFALNQYASSPTTNLMLKPLLESIELEGKLTADVDLDIDSSDIKSSQGMALLTIQNMVLKSLNSNLAIPNQIFSKVLVKANLQNGELVFDKSSALVSQDLFIGLAGKLTQKPNLSQSLLDFTISLQLGAPLMEQLGFILDTLTQRDTQGKIQIRIQGPVEPQPQISIL